MFAYFINLIFVVYNFLIFVRLMGSWFPNAHNKNWFQGLVAITDPYLNLFRGWIPKFFGLDFSPVIALFVLQIVSWLFARIFIK